MIRHWKYGRFGRRPRSVQSWVAILAILAMSAAACGDGGSEEATTTTGSETETTMAEGSDLEGPIVVGSRGGSIGAAEKELIWDPFSAATGVEVIQFEAPDTDAIVNAQCEADRVELGFTITTQSGYKTLTENDCLSEIDYNAFPDEAQNVLDTMPEDAVLPYGIAVSTIGVNLAYSTEAFPEGSAPQTWADFWNVDEYPGGRAMPSFPFFTLEIALLADGVASEDLYPIDADRAFAKLEEIKPHIVNWWEAGAVPPQLLIDGEATASVAYNGRIENALTEGASLGYSWNQALTYHDYGVLPKDSPHPETALAALGYMFTPSVAADISAATRYPIPSTLVWESAPEDQAARWPTSPENVGALAQMDFLWWAEPAEDGSGLTNQEVLQERMNEFIASG